MPGQFRLTPPGGTGGSSTFISLSDVPNSYVGQALKVVQVNAGETALQFVTLAGGGDALTANPLSQFAATTSAQLAGVISDEVGSGKLVFNTSPGFVTAITPTVNDGAALGTTALQWSDLFLAEGGVINWDNGDVTITQTNNVLVFAGATTSYDFDALLQPILAGVGLRVVNTTDNASVQVAKFEGDRATMADNDEAYVSLILSNDAGTQSEFARITWIASDVNAGTNIDGTLTFSVVTAGTLAKEVQLTGTDFSPATSDGNALGTASLMWSDLFLASGAVINFNNGDITVTHAANNLLFAGAASGYTFDAEVYPTTDDGAALGDATHNFSDLFLASGAVINFNNGDVTITHSSNVLAFAGASTKYTFDALVAPTTSDGAALGSTALMWSDLFLASGAVVNFNNGDVTVTHSADLITIAGGNVIVSSAGTASGSVATIDATQILTNKFLTPRLQTVADAGGTLTPNADTNDMVIATGLSQATAIANPSGTPVQGQKLIIRVKDDGTARSISFGTQYRGGDTTLPNTTATSKTLYMGFIYNSTDTKWDIVAKDDNH